MLQIASHVAISVMETANVDIVLKGLTGRARSSSIEPSSAPDGIGASAAIGYSSSLVDTIERSAVSGRVPMYADDSVSTYS